MRAGVYDLVISIRMPRMDGFEMVKNIRRNPTTGPAGDSAPYMTGGDG